jgi:hypothetical protein
MGELLRAMKTKSFMAVLEKKVKEDLRAHPEKLALLRKVLDELEQESKDVADGQ